MRITIGWHFFYEGVWKIANADKFSAEPFLSMAKGPAAPLFYAMIPDLDGRQRLTLRSITEDEANDTLLPPITASKAGGELFQTSPIYEDAWKQFKSDFDKAYPLEDAKKADVEYAWKQYLISLRGYLTDNKDAIAGLYGSLDRHNAAVATGANQASHQKKRDWDGMMKLRSEARGYLAELDAMTSGMQTALYRAAAIPAKAQMPTIVLAPNKLPLAVPMIDSRLKWLDVSVTYGLTAIGLCLMLGLCTRLASLGGAAFLVSVLMTQPPWPPIYPPAPEVVGHALIVDKNFVEMVALLLLVTVPAGRWAGLDFFLYRLMGEKIEAKYTRKLDEPKIPGAASKKK